MPDLFSVPRRFDLFTILVAITGYALVFTFFRVIRFLYADPYADGTYMFAVAGGLLAAVAAGQAILTRYSPRKASIIASCAYWMVILIGFALIGEIAGWHRPTGPIVLILLYQAIAAAFVGLLTGYPAGVLAAGVFLVSHHLRENWSFLRMRKPTDGRQSPWDEGRPLQPVPTELQPESDGAATAPSDKPPLKLTPEELQRSAVFDAAGNLLYIRPAPPV